MSNAVDGTYIKAQQDKMVNSSLCKKASVDTYFNVMVFRASALVLFALSATLAGREDYEVTGGTVEFKGKDLLALSPEDRAGEGIKQRKRQTEKSAQWRRSYYPTAPALDADESASGAESR